MKFSTLEAVFRALEGHGVRFLVAGGVAVNAHGYRRLTHDLDLVLAMDRPNILAAFAALSELGYRPQLPLKAEDVADEGTRASWIRDRNLQVLTLVSDEHPDTVVALFVQEPFDFEAEVKAARPAEVGPDLRVRFVTVGTLIRMKEGTGRPRDQDDVEHLRRIKDLEESR